MARKGESLSLETKMKMSLSTKGRIISKEWRTKLSHSKIGNKNRFLGDEAKDSSIYHRVHRWVEKNLGKPKVCDFCLSDNKKRYDWANVSQEYKYELSDWLRLCRSCHKAFDHQIKLILKGEKNEKTL